jgi:selenocysteine-specific elongation factor
VEVVPGGAGGGSLDRAGLPARVRSLQRHQQRVERIGPGTRTAANLAGLSHDRLWRGQALVRPGQWAPTRSLDASLSVLPGLDHDVTRRGAYHLYAGSGEHPARLRVLGAPALAPGESGLVRIQLPTPLPLLPGDRYVLRESGRVETVGGGEVLDVAPVLPPSRARPDRSVERVVAERGWIEAALLERLTGEPAAPNVAGRWVVSPQALDEVRAALRARVRAAGPLGLDTSVLSERERAVMRQDHELVVDAGRVMVAGTADAAAGELAQAQPWLAALEAQPFSPPPPEGIDPQVVRELVRRGVVVARDGMYFASSAVQGAARVIAEMLAGQPQGVTASEIREALGTTRKYLLPLLAELDATGMTRRRGDLRQAGPLLSRQTRVT